MMPSSAFPFGLDSVARVYASSVSTSMSAYEELPGHHLRSTLDLIASTLAFEYLDSTETQKQSPVQLLLDIMTPETDDLTYTHHTTTSAL
jgi:hypothetical protein